MKKGTSGFLAFILGVILLYFPGRTAWAFIITVPGNTVDTKEEVITLSNKYETATCEEQVNMISYLTNPQRAHLEALHARTQQRLCDIKKIEIVNKEKL